ncbi:DNA-dependent protein kinase catalytic subunit [Rhizoctonia solani]|uniref:DNA-dependent protein kinase catalytic subunit n=1 Tax=Rhizoctonia solani TaxID=456999 RepID=A0A0K6G4Y3_9AGAM|nr:DNA-dependent protein kinase catalytic subunit [Rhizoctonia solani]
MLTPLADAPHPLWGRSYPTYLASYTNEALAVPLSPMEEPQLKMLASKAIEEICKLEHSRGVDFGGNIVKGVTLSMLTALLEMTKIPGYFRRMVEPRLIPGCVDLMTSVKPSPFQYEYGYACFRILVLAVNACLLEGAGYLDVVIARMETQLASQRFPVFWEMSAFLVNQAHGNDIILAPMIPDAVDKLALGRLLQLLNSDRKLFFAVSKNTGSLSLPGLFFIIFRDIVATEIPPGYQVQEDSKVFVKLIQPYSRVLWRYLIVSPDSGNEEMLMANIHNDIAPYTRLNNDKPVDAEDARNLVQAYNERLESTSTIWMFIIMRFVGPLVAPGCENLVPTTIKLCIELLWSSLLNGHDMGAVRYSVGGVLCYFRDMVQALKPRYFIPAHQTWVQQIMDYVIEGDLIDLVLRAMLTSLHFGELSSVEGNLLSAAIEFILALDQLVPNQDFMFRLHDAGSFGDWTKYYFYFRVCGTEATFCTFGRSDSTAWACGEIIAGIMEVILGPSDWMYGWGGPHADVCTHQAQQYPASRKEYHRVPGTPLGFVDGFFSLGGKSLATELIDLARENQPRSKGSHFNMMVMDDNNPRPLMFVSGSGLSGSAYH